MSKIWELVEFMKEARKEQNISQRDLAGMIPVTNTTLHYWEKHKRMPSLDDIGDVLSLLGYEVEIKVVKKDGQRKSINNQDGMDTI